MSHKVTCKSFALIFFITACVLTTTFSPIAASSMVPSSESTQTTNLSGNDWWSMFRHDETHSGVSLTTTPADSDVLWTHETGYLLSSSPAVSHGRVYIGSWDRNIYCFDMDTGTILWNYSTLSEITSSPAVADGKVYVGSQDTKLYCLDAIDGSFQWAFRTDFIVETSPTVVDDKVFFGSSDGSLYCLDADDGSLVWEYETNSVIVSSPAVVDEKVYIGIVNGNFVCLNSNTGGVLWIYPLTSGIYSSPAVEDGKVFFGANDYYVYCLDADNGSLLWNYDAQSEVHSSPAIAYDLLFIGTSDGRMLCLQQDTGNFVWSYTISGSVESSPAVGDGKVYFATDPCCGFTSYFFCLNAYTGALLWSYNLNTELHTKSSPALATGKVFIGSGEGKIVVFGDIQYLADANGPYKDFVNTSVQFTGSVYGGQPGYTWYWDLGDGTTSTEQNPVHSYSAVGEYPVTLTVTDNLGEIATDDTWVIIDFPNTPPESPIIDGPTTGQTNVPYGFHFTSSDQNNDSLLYYIDWGDNLTSGWLGPYPSSIPVYQNHTWSGRGNYLIKAKVKDQHGAESNWSDPFGISITALQLVIELKGGFGLTVTIRNTGDVVATSASWNVTSEKGLVIAPTRLFVPQDILPGAQRTEKILVLGFGKTSLSVSAWCEEGLSIEKTINATLLLFFVIGSG